KPRHPVRGGFAPERYTLGLTFGPPSRNAIGAVDRCSLVFIDVLVLASAARRSPWTHRLGIASQPVWRMKPRLRPDSLIASLMRSPRPSPACRRGAPEPTILRAACETRSNQEVPGSLEWRRLCEVGVA